MDFVITSYQVIYPFSFSMFNSDLSKLFDNLTEYVYIHDFCIYTDFIARNIMARHASSCAFCQGNDYIQHFQLVLYLRCLFFASTACSRKSTVQNQYMCLAEWCS